MVQNQIITTEELVNRIYLIRDKKVMLDKDLAELYEVENKQLKRAVRRHIQRFPSDFLFELTNHEYELLRSQIGTLKRGEHSKYPPFAFTEQGVAMLSSVLNTERAIKVNIIIIRAFVQLRNLIDTNKDLARKIDELEQKYDEKFKVVFQALKSLIQKEDKPRKEIGFKLSNNK